MKLSWHFDKNADPGERETSDIWNLILEIYQVTKWYWAMLIVYLLHKEVSF